MDTFAQAVKKIIEEQEAIIGPIAVEQAKKVSGLQIDWPKHEVKIEGNASDILEKLVKNYEHLFGRASVEVCRDAIKSLNISKDQLPSLLQ